MAGGSGKVDHSLDKPKLLTCLTRSVRNPDRWTAYVRILSRSADSAAQPRS